MVSVAVTVNERGIKDENAGPDSAGQFYDCCCSNGCRKLMTVLLSQRNFTLPIWLADENQLSGCSLTNGLPQYRNSVKISWTKLKKLNSTQNGESLSLQHDSWPWWLGHLSPNCVGVPLPIFYAEDGTPIKTAETIEHVAQLWRAWFHYLVAAWAKDLLPEGFTYSRFAKWRIYKRNRYHGRVWFDSGSSWNGAVVPNVLNSNIQRISKFRTTVVGSTHLLSHLYEPWCCTIQPPWFWVLLWWKGEKDV